MSNFLLSLSPTKQSLSDLLKSDHHLTLDQKWLNKIPDEWLKTIISQPSWLLNNINHSLEIFSPRQYSIIKLLSTISGGLIGLLIIILASNSLLGIWQLVGGLTGLVIGWLLPDIYVKDRNLETELEIERQIPEFLLLLSIVLESSGHQSLVQALDQTALTVSGKLGEIIHQVCRHQPFTTSEQLLTKLTEVCPQPLIKELAQQVQLTNSYGGSVTKVVHQLADQAIQDQVIKAQEQGDQMSGLLLGPILIFHLPALLILFLIPSVIAFTQSL